jgi:hypothetical protein
VSRADIQKLGSLKIYAPQPLCTGHTRGGIFLSRRAWRWPYVFRHTCATLTPATRYPPLPNPPIYTC